jgi:hypothetical protein
MGIASSPGAEESTMVRLLSKARHDAISILPVKARMSCEQRIEIPSRHEATPLGRLDPDIP